VVAEPAALAVALAAVAAEALHARRCRRLARLAFGPSGRPAPWARLAPAARVLALAALAWGLVTLYLLPPRVRAAAGLSERERRHLLLVLDVSPSMRLADAGPEGKQPRAARARDLMESFFARVPAGQYLVSVVACYNGAKPVVVDTKDMEVVRNILGDLPMHHAFRAGKTDLFAGLAEAAKVAKPWPPGSGTLVVVTDGDTVPPKGMPELPPSIRDVVLAGVGDPTTGRFIDGGMSRQDAGTLRQVAARLRGTYHNGNAKQLPSELIARVSLASEAGAFERLTRREYALFACGLGAAVLALLPVLLHHFGTRWRPGVAVGAGAAAVPSRISRPHGAAVR
jgi:Ca-activated chloride channel family protein